MIIITITVQYFPGGYRDENKVTYINLKKDKIKLFC